MLNILCDITHDAIDKHVYVGQIWVSGQFNYCTTMPAEFLTIMPTQFLNIISHQLSS